MELDEPGWADIWAEVGTTAFEKLLLLLPLYMLAMILEADMERSERSTAFDGQVERRVYETFWNMFLTLKAEG